MLELIEIDADERYGGRVVFDTDDIEGAFTELDARYLAGEAAALRRPRGRWSRRNTPHSIGTNCLGRTDSGRRRPSIPWPRFGPGELMHTSAPHGNLTHGATDRD